ERGEVGVPRLPGDENHGDSAGRAAVSTAALPDPPVSRDHALDLVPRRRRPVERAADVAEPEDARGVPAGPARRLSPPADPAAQAGKVVGLEEGVRAGERGAADPDGIPSALPQPAAEPGGAAVPPGPAPHALGG